MSELEADLGQTPSVYLLKSIMQGPANERLKMNPSNAEWVSICGDKPTPGGYSLTVSWSKTISAADSRLGNDEILSTIAETNDGSLPKYCFVLTFLVCSKKGGTK